ncbi:PadR family transcriptional regulator [Novosphingobium nitrogenifigens DSM 19370]|uniref:PadR family transcriptional regulator n=1 Tax=Novosphingobium nitrogenifigens DSM 19370 TaxID=983920 RepID=F1ZB29_9SPHN|nr:PadR family transcriptional regulator [Novosphingobium nitrogenifigens]EGD58104.1 PadR family transcriptional regulator [Novosphingobium nitrogenifigens DSM 19370]
MRFDKSRCRKGRMDRAGWARDEDEGTDTEMMGGPGMGRRGRMFGHFMGRSRGGWGDDEGGPFGRRGGFGGFGGRGMGGRGGGRGGRMFAQGELRLLLLSLLGDASRHGYDLIKAVEELTGGAYAPSPGVVYPTLALLVDEGLIVEAPGEGARKAFVATEAGKAEIAARSEEIGVIVDRLKALGEASDREASPPVMRAMTNLKLALKGRVFAKGFDEDVAHKIAEILDEAARRIERL